jgi:hypothetical protein
MTAAAFWRAWSIWAISVAATVVALSYTAVRPLPGHAGNAANWVIGVVFIGAFATMGALLAWKRWGIPSGGCCLRPAWRTPLEPSPRFYCIFLGR